MLAISAATHLFLGIAALSFPFLAGTPRHLEPVAVVDLVGGGEFRRESPKPPEPVAGESERSAPRERTPPAPPPSRGHKGTKKPRPDDLALSRRQAADIDSLAERMRKMRETRAGSESVREAVEEHRREAAARAAVRRVGERVAHRIEAPQPARPAARGAAGGGGAQGTVRLSPELRDYFRRLEESVRNSWILPGALVRDAANLQVEIRIVIEKNGRVSREWIEQGSGNAWFDDSVRRAIRKASPLPVPPEQLRGGEDHYEIGFRFHGGGG